MTTNKSTQPADTTLTDLGHLAFCALTALGLARQEGQAPTPYAETLFLIRWLVTAQKQKRFPKSVAGDIDWLLARGRRYGATAKLRQHLDYLWRSTTGVLAEQSDLFRLTHVTETLKDLGWETAVLSSTEWAPMNDNRVVITGNGFLVEKLALHRAFDSGGRQTAPVAFYIAGEVAVFCQTMTDNGFTVRTGEKTPAYVIVTLLPPSTAVDPLS